MKLYKGSHWVFRGGFHFIFKTKHHEPIFRGSIEEAIRSSLMTLKEKHKIVDLEIRIFPYHIHLFLAPLHGTSPLEFGRDALSLLDEVVYRHYGTRNVFDENFYSSTLNDISPKTINKILKPLSTK